MNKISKDRNQPSAVARYAVILAVGWTLMVAASMAWNCISEKDTQISSASEAARDQIAMDVLYRRWNASLGGVYVPVSDSCQPNPYLVDVAGRDIETPSGLHLTLVNPSYMTRQVHELGLLVDGVRGHITSLKPLRPENAADTWEKRALESFERGETEFATVEKLDGQEYLRLMRPLVTEQECLKCHAKQGYKEGDVRGGISVSMPMSRFEAIAQEDMAAIGLGHGVLWLLGLAFLVIGARSVRGREQKRRLAEDALIASEDRFRQLFENAPLGYQSLDENGNFIAVNEAWCKALGYTKEEVLGRNFGEFLHPDFRKVFKENFPKFKSLGQILGIEFEMIKKDGTEIIVAFDGRISYDDDGSFKQTHCVFKDITKRKRVEEALRENQARLDLALKSANMGVWYIDLEGNKRGFDDQTCLLLGLDPHEFKGTSEEFYRVVHPDDRERITTALYSSIERKTLYDVEYRCVWPDGTIHYMNGRGMTLYSEDGSPRRMNGVLWDITERKQSEEALRKSEERLRDITFSMADWVWEVDENGVYTYSSQQSIDILGRSREEIIGKTPFDFMPQDEAQRVAQIFAEIVARKAPIRDLENWNIAMDGRRICLLTSGVPILDDEGNLKGYRGVDKDITERKEMESRLREQGDKYRGIFDESIAAIYIFNKEKKFIDSNQAGLELLGYSREQLLSMSIPDVDADAGVVLPAHQQLLSGDRIVNYEHRLVRKDGKVVTVLNNSRPLTDSNGVVVGMQSTLVDITRRKLAEEELWESREVLHSVFNSLPVRVFWKDKNSVFLGCNTSFARDAGFEKPEDIIGRDDSDMGWREQADLYQADDRAVIESGEARLLFEEPQTTPSGEQLHLLTSKLPLRDAGGAIVGVLGSYLDITDRIRAEQKVKLRESYLTSIIENQPGLMWLKDADGRFQAVNKAFALACGLEHPKKLVGLTDLDIWPRELAYKYRRDDSEVMEARASKIVEEIVQDQGRPKWFETFKTPVVNEQGNVIGTTGYSRDITERKRAEEALRESEARLFELASQVPGAVYQFYARPNGEHGFYYISDKSEQIVGLKPELDGFFERFTALVHPAYRESFLTSIGKAISECTDWNFEGILQKPTGETIWFSAQSRHLRRESEVIFNGIVFDITERKRSAEALRESEATHAEAQRIAHLGHWRLDLTANWLDWSAEVFRIFDIDPQEFAASYEAFLNTIHPEDRTLVNQAYTDSLKSREPYDIVHRLLMKDGTVKFVHERCETQYDEAGNPMFSLGTVLDITERKHAEEALRESENRYHKLFNSTLEGLGVVDKNEVIEYCNQAYADIFEAGTQEDLIGRSLLDFVPQQLQNKVLAQTELRKQGLNSQYEIDIVTARNNRKTVLASISPRFDEQGNYCGASGAIIDISETKRLQELESRALRLETAGQIAGQVAHDFNNMLAPMMAYPELIREQLPVGDPSRKYLEAIEESAKRIADLNQQLLTLSRRGHYNQEVLNLNDIIQQVLRDMASPPSTLVIESDLCPKLMNIEGGIAQLHRVVMNLVMNARDAVRDIGRVSVRTENSFIDDTTVMYGRIPRGEYIKLTVIDSGCGIPDEIMQKIFDPFFTTKSTDKKRGSGLGLSVVDAVVKDHNGFIDLTTTVGVGTSFYLYFPVTRAAVSERPSDEIPRGTESILVVDDDEIQCEVSSRLLSTLGYEVTVCDSGKKAVELLAHSTFDLLLLDMIMPSDICGTETYRRALQIRPDQKAIIVSGFSESGRVTEAQKLGAGAFVKKPLSRRTLALAVRKELDRKVEVPSCS